MNFRHRASKELLTRYAQAPGQEYSVADLQGIGKIEQGVSGGVAWEKSALMGARVKTVKRRSRPFAKPC